MKAWTTQEEAARLGVRFAALKSKGGSQAKFARDNKVPGGASMITQHIKHTRTIGMDAAIAYARGFKVPLEEISPRLASQAVRIAEASPPASEAQRLRHGVQMQLQSFHTGSHAKTTTIKSADDLDIDVSTTVYTAFVKLGAAMLKEDDVTREQMLPLLKKLLQHPDQADALGTRAARIVDVDAAEDAEDPPAASKAKPSPGFGKQA